MSEDAQPENDPDENPIKGPDFDIMSDEETEERSNRILDMIDEAEKSQDNNE